MASFPLTPANGDLFSQGNVDYIYNLASGSWLIAGDGKTVSTENITGAVAFDVAGHDAAVLTLTGDVTSLSWTGWESSGEFQAVTITLKQGTTGNHTYQTNGVFGLWVEDVPSVYDSQAGDDIVQFEVYTYNDGADVYLRPIGIGYSMDCLYSQTVEVDIPIVEAGSFASVGHNFSIVGNVELIVQATGRRVLADWWQQGGMPDATVNIDFTDAVVAGQYKVRVTGMARVGCDLSASSSEFVTFKLAVQAATTIRPKVAWTGAGAAVEVIWGDGTSFDTYASGNQISHTYGTPYTGDVTFRYQKNSGIVLTELEDILAGNTWSFDLADLPSTLTRVFFRGSNLIKGDLVNAPRGLTFLNVQGSNTLSGSLAGAPAGLDTLTVTGLNTITGSIANAPVGLTSLNVTGSNTLNGSIVNAPAGLTNITVQGANVISGDIAGVPTGLTTITILGLNTLSGDIAAVPTALTTLNIQGANTVSGDLANLPSGLQHFITLGSNTLSGDLAAAPAGLIRFMVTSVTNTIVYTGGYGFGSMNQNMTLEGGSLAAASVDQILIDMAAAGLTATSARAINLADNNDPRTAASDAAITTLAGNGWTTIAFN